MPNVKYQIVELDIPVGGALPNYKFGQQQFLLRKQIISIEIFSSNDLSTSPNGIALATPADLKRCYLTFYGEDPEDNSKDGQWLETMPAWKFHSLSNGTDPFEFWAYEMVPRNLVWEKSFAQFIGGPATTGNAIAVLLLVGYMGLLEP